MVLQLRRIVSNRHAGGALAQGTNSIAGELELIADSQNVRRLQL
jgi:hypothetical protein